MSEEKEGTSKLLKESLNEYMSHSGFTIEQIKTQQLLLLGKVKAWHLQNGYSWEYWFALVSTPCRTYCSAGR